MSQLFDKIKKVQPLVRARKSQMDEQITILSQIRAEKIALVAVMKENQRQYMDGVDKLNEVRNSSNRQNLEFLEQGLDVVKSRWYKLHLDAQTMENKERVQIAQVLAAQQELRKIEKLRERYEVSYHQEIASQEQKQQDERTLDQFVRQK